MTNEQLFDLILTKARRGGDTNLRAVIRDELRQMLQSWERGPFHPWFLEKRSSGLVTIPNDDTIEVPDDFLMLVEDTKVWIINTEGTKIELPRMYHEDIEVEFLNDDPALPKNYDIFGDEFVFGPTPDGVYDIRCKYYATTTVPVDGVTEVDNLWALNAEDLFVTEAAARLHRNYIKDQKQIDVLTDKSNQLRSELHKYNEARKHSNMDYDIDR